VHNIVFICILWFRVIYLFLLLSSKTKSDKNTIMSEQFRNPNEKIVKRVHKHELLLSFHDWYSQFNKNKYFTLNMTKSRPAIFPDIGICATSLQIMTLTLTDWIGAPIIYNVLICNNKRVIQRILIQTLRCRILIAGVHSNILFMAIFYNIRSVILYY
jgi:hypothetical protein